MAHYNFISAATGVASFAFQPTGGTYLTGAAGLIGIWSVDQSVYLDPAAATEDNSFLDIVYSGDTAVADGGALAAGLDVETAYINPARFQIVQQRTTGQPYATPIIYGKDVTSVDYIPYGAATLASATVVCSAPAAATTTNRLKVVITGMPTGYDTTLAESNNSMAHMAWKVGAVFNYEFTGTNDVDVLGGTGGVGVSVTATLGADSQCPVTVAYNAGTDTLTFTAKEVGMTFAIAVNPSGLADEDDFAAPTYVAMDSGQGVGAAVRAAEKKSASHWGYHNRIWLNKEPELFGAGHSAIDGYSCIQIKAKNRYNGGGSAGVFDNSFKNGVNGDITINMWVDRNWTTGDSAHENAWGIMVAAVGTAKSYTFSNGVGITNVNG